VLNNRKTERWIAALSFIVFCQVASAHLSGPSTVQSTSPSIGSLLGGTKVTINGGLLYLPESVSFGGVPATVVSSGTTFIKVVAPAHSVGTVDVTVVNSAGYKTVLTNGYTYTIALSPSSLPDGIAGISYNRTLEAAGGTAPYHWSVVAGSLPSGLQLGSGGNITGVPAANYGTSTFTVQATDSSSPKLVATIGLSIAIDIGLLPGPIPASFFGMSVINPKVWPSASLGAFGKGGETTWPYLEPSKGIFNWTRLDAFVANAKAHGTTMYLTNSGVPSWAAANTSTCTFPQGTSVCTSMVADISDWDDFCTALVQRYKGQIMMYELWNEPDEPSFTGTLADMVELTTHLYNIIRANDPNALIASPSIIRAPWFGNYFAAGAPRGVDVIATHGYLENSGNVAEALAAAKTAAWHPIMIRYGLQSKPLWDTESSWGTDTGAGLDAEAQAAFLTRDYLLHWSAGITAFYWYAWDSPTWGTLWTSTPSEAGLAYTQVSNWMIGASMPEPCSAQGTVYTCPLARANGYSALAVWDASKTCTTAGGCPTSNFKAPAGFVQYRCLNGTVNQIQPGEVVLIGAKPILLENQNPPN